MYRSPDIILKELGITSASDIDVEAIAYYCGAMIRYRVLEGCAARIVGSGSKAIITIDSTGTIGRKRFSAAHELGHWMNHRGTQFLICKNSDIFSSDRSRSPESIANMYAADLLLPEFLFKPASRNRALTFETASSLAEEFRTSLTATTIRLIELGSYPGILACYDSSGHRKWYCKSSDVPRNFMPHQELHHETQAFDVLFGKHLKPKPCESCANLWFAIPSAATSIVVEQALSIGIECILVLLWFKDESLLQVAIND